MKAGGSPITYVHGDTTTAMASSLAAFGERQGLVHVEAGLRTLSPKPEVLRGWLEQGAQLDWASYRDQSVSRDSYEKGSKEPSPEQFNSRVADAGSDLHAAPVCLEHGRICRSQASGSRRVAVIPRVEVVAGLHVWGHCQSVL